MYSPHGQDKFPKGVLIVAGCAIACLLICYSVSVLPVIFQRIRWEVTKPADYYLDVQVMEAWRPDSLNIGVCVKEGVEISSRSSSEVEGDYPISQISSMRDVLNEALRCSLDVLSCELEFDANDYYPLGIYFWDEERIISSHILVGEDAQLRCEAVD